MDSVQEGYDAFLLAKRSKAGGNRMECRRMHGEGFDAVSSERESCFAFLCMFGFRAEGGLAEKRAGTEMRTDCRRLFSVRIDHFRLAFCERIYYNKREGTLHETERYTLHQTVSLWLRHGCTCGGELNDICPPRKTRCCSLRLVRRTACCGR